ncbi:MAG: MFS transporter [Propionibacteriales bacterium]|nr:MFS transporter [Propionibacteriales bacterium]
MRSTRNGTYTVRARDHLADALAPGTRSPSPCTTSPAGSTPSHRRKRMTSGPGGPTATTRRRFTPLVGWLSAETISLTGIVGFAEMAPYVLAKALGGPLIDRFGARRVSAAADSLSLVVVGPIPLLHHLDALSYPALLLLVGAAERLATTAGAAAAGVLIAWIGPVAALTVDAASFGVAAALIAGTAPRRVHQDEHAEAGDGYLARLRAGWDFLRRDPVLVAITVMVGTTNLLDQAFLVVLVPVWADHPDRGPEIIGLLFAVFAAMSTVGSLTAAAIAERLPRFATYLLCFLITGAPRFLVLALDMPLSVVVAVFACGGLASGFLNPILGAVIFDRIPKPLVGRVSSLTTSLSWAGMPLGGVVGGTLIAAAGLAPALVVCGTAYLVATMLPAVRAEWRQIERRRPTLAA